MKTIPTSVFTTDPHVSISMVILFAVSMEFHLLETSIGILHSRNEREHCVGNMFWYFIFVIYPLRWKQMSTSYEHEPF